MPWRYCPVSESILTQKLTFFFISNGCVILPFTYFFYPETRLRSLEEMDSVFHKTTSWFNCVKIAANEPYRYDKHGNLLISYDQADDPVAERRRSSVVSQEKVRAAENGSEPSP